MPPACWPKQTQARSLGTPWSFSWSAGAYAITVVGGNDPSQTDNDFFLNQDKSHDYYYRDLGLKQLIYVSPRMKMQYTDSSEAAPIWALAIFTYAFFGVVALSKVLPSHLVLTPGVGKAVLQS